MIGSGGVLPFSQLMMKKCHEVLEKERVPRSRDSRVIYFPSQSGSLLSNRGHERAYPRPIVLVMIPCSGRTSSKISRALLPSKGSSIRRIGNVCRLVANQGTLLADLSRVFHLRYFLAGSPFLALQSQFPEQRFLVYFEINNK